MFTIGCHLSASKGFVAMGRDALSIKANTFQFFTRNPRGSKAKALDLDDIAQFLALREENHFGPLLAHAPYTLNGCGKEERVRQFALETIKDDLERLRYIPHCYYNFHPGSHVGQGTENGIEQIAQLLNQVLREDQPTTVLLETMAGKGTEVGRTFEELAAIIERVTLSDLVGVCLDSCHIHDGGYDIIHHLDNVLAEFDRIIGLNKLKAIHLNDSMNPLGAHKDRHAKIGQGHIGLEALANLINHPLLRDLPFFLETPNEDLAGYGEEIALLKSLRKES